jgi:cytochrome c
MKKLLLFLTTSLILTACGGEEDVASAAPQETIAPKAVVELTPIQRGAKIYARCRACHTLGQGERHKVGPNLWNVYGSTAGTKEGFAYSKAMKASGVVWDETTMDAYLTRPAQYMPGNKMTFIGLKKQEDRDAVQAYMKDKTTP